MELSIFSVAFQIKKAFFSLENFKLSLPAWWSFTWRSTLVGLAIGLLLGIMILSNTTLSFTTLAVAAVVLVLGAVYISARIQYYCLFEKEYKTINRSLTGEVFAFHSWEYWKRILLTFLMSFVSGLIIQTITQIFFTGAHDIIIGLLLNFLWWNIFLHGGTWNFIPTKKEAQQKQTSP